MQIVLKPNCDKHVIIDLLQIINYKYIIQIQILWSIEMNSKRLLIFAFGLIFIVIASVAIVKLARIEKDAPVAADTDDTLPSAAVSDRVSDSDDNGVSSDESEDIDGTASDTALSLSDNDYSCFDNSCFIGNSRVEALKDYGVLTNCDVFASVGLNIRTVYTEAAPGRSLPISEDIRYGNYDKFFILFGDNEIGWPYQSVFLDEYGDFIDHVHEAQPNADIYIMSILPISKTAEASNNYGYNNSNIDALNGKLRVLAADHNAVFLNPAEVIKDSDGALPESASTDGIHFGKSYCITWADYLKSHIS